MQRELMTCCCWRVNLVVKNFGKTSMTTMMVGCVGSILRSHILACRIASRSGQCYACNNKSRRTHGRRCWCVHFEKPSPRPCRFCARLQMPWLLRCTTCWPTKVAAGSWRCCPPMSRICPPGGWRCACLWETKDMDMSFCSLWCVKETREF
jgi:hypothetical protein